MAMRLPSGSSFTSSRPRFLASSRRVGRSLVLYSRLGLVSKTRIAATGRSLCRFRFVLNSLGRAKAMQIAAMRKIRSAKSSRCRSRSLRWLVRCFCKRKRNAGNSSSFGFCRMIRCSRIGMPASSKPPRSAGKTKLIGPCPSSAVTRFDYNQRADWPRDERKPQVNAGTEPQMDRTADGRGWTRMDADEIKNQALAESRKDRLDLVLFSLSASIRVHLRFHLEARNGYTFAALHGRLVSADADHGPVGAGFGVGQSGFFAEDGHEEVVSQMGMAAAVTAALQERQVLGILDGGRLREASDRLRQQAGVIRHLHALGNLRLAERFFLRALGVYHRLLALDLLPLEALLRSGGIKTLTI